MNLLLLVLNICYAAISPTRTAQGLHKRYPATKYYSTIYFRLDYVSTHKHPKSVIYVPTLPVPSQIPRYANGNNEKGIFSVPLPTGSTEAEEADDIPSIPTTMTRLLQNFSKPLKLQKAAAKMVTKADAKIPVMTYPNVKAIIIPSRCGSSWENANENCGPVCTPDTNCTMNNEKCFDNLQISCRQKQKQVKHNKSKQQTTSMARCGSTWAKANNKCGMVCKLDNQCSGGEKCQRNLAVSCDEPKKGLVHDAAIMPESKTWTRCGATWVDANLKCGAVCIMDKGCSNGEKCYADLKICD